MSNFETKKIVMDGGNPVKYTKDDVSTLVGDGKNRGGSSNKRGWVKEGVGIYYDRSRGNWIYNEEAGKEKKFLLFDKKSDQK